MNFNFSYYFVFDVESIGLHGEGFAAAFAVFDLNGVKIEQQVFACDPSNASGDDLDRQWVRKNVPVQTTNCATPKEVRALLLKNWLKWKALEAGCFADCVWPVESSFLSTAIKESIEVDGESAKWNGPYPLIDITAIEFVICGPQGLALERDVKVFVPHDPLADVEFSAKRLFQLLAQGTRPAKIET